MATLPETPNWDVGIYQLETTDIVEGGADGVDNVQAKSLANRTSWLKAAIEALTGLFNSHEEAIDPHPQYLTPADAQANAMRTAVVGGTADAITATYAPTITTLVNGMTLGVRAASANTTNTPTFTPSAGTIAAKNIVKGNGLALEVGDIAGAGHWLDLKFDAALDKWMLLNPSRAVTTKGIQRFTANGKFTVPAGVTMIFTSGCAGGGGGGSCQPTTATNQASGAGGGGGAGQSIVRQAFAVTPGQVISITIGAGGAGAISGGAIGTAGGNTVVGALVTLTGGSGGNIGAVIVGNGIGAAGGAGYPAGGYGSDASVYTNAAGGNSGDGGGTPFGNGGRGVRNALGNAIAGQSAVPGGYGGGGSGGGGITGGVGAYSSAVGGAGAPGIVIIEW